MSRKGVVEIGSTNTKAYELLDNRIIDLGFKNIEFKKNYSLNNSISAKDIEMLMDYIDNTFRGDFSVYVYATSVFREIDEEENNAIKRKLSLNPKIISFEIVSAKKENEYTVLGALKDVSLEENTCVFVGGGGSTEISICNNKKIIEMKNTNIGVGDVIKAFPDLGNEVAVTSVDTVTRYILERLQLPRLKSRYLIMAGGDFLLRYELANYPYKENTLFSSQTHPYYITYEENRRYEDVYYHNIRLSDLKKLTPNNPNWWNGSRAMLAFTNAVALSIGAKYLIPTRISMIYGIANTIR